MVRCLELYYRQARSQKEIAQALGVSAATVSRLLKRAYDDGLVRVELDLPRAEELEAALTERFGLRDAVVVAAGGRGDLKEELGAAAAAYFEKIASNGIRVGLSCGVTLYQTIRQLRERRRLLRDPEIRSIFEAAQAVDIALVGIGMIGEQTPGFCALAESYGVSVKRLRQLGVVGEINYQPFDAAGHTVDRPELRVLMHRILSVEVGRLQTLSRRSDRHVVAIAGGRPKLDAVRGALAGRFMNVLVTDEDLAGTLLRRTG